MPYAPGVGPTHMHAASRFGDDNFDAPAIMEDADGPTDGDPGGDGDLGAEDDDFGGFDE